MAGRRHIAIVVFVFLTTGAAVVGRSTFPGNMPVEPAVQASGGLVAEGQRIFRFDTFGDEQLWTDTLHMNEVVEKNVDPTTALSVGLKVDASVLPPGILSQVDLKYPEIIQILLKIYNNIIKIDNIISRKN